MKNKFKIDCKWFNGEKPCKFKETCANCKHYSPTNFKILIIKLAALGDVLRTTTILRGIKRHYLDSHVTWITDINAVELLKFNPFIDTILPFNLESILRLQIEEFDLLYSLDKEIRATSLAEHIKAKEKKGFSFHPRGNIYPLNKESHYAFMLGICDDLKFNINQKTYQEIIFELCGLVYKDDEYVLNLLPEELEEAKNYLISLGIKSNIPIIGMNPGAGNNFAAKKWTVEGFAALANKMNGNMNINILLLGGEEEFEMNRAIKERVNFEIIDTGLNNSLRKFGAIIGNCNCIVTSDTLGMHLAIAQNVPPVVFFGPTCFQEIELYGRGKKIIANKDYCTPCYSNECSRKESCMEKLDFHTVYNAIIEVLKD